MIANRTTVFVLELQRDSAIVQKLFGYLRHLLI